jgi:hypothetical protein
MKVNIADAFFRRLAHFMLYQECTHRQQEEYNMWHLTTIQRVFCTEPDDSDVEDGWY